MTVIAWDGKTLAADKRMNFGTSFVTVTKIHRIDGKLVGFSGDSAQGRSCIQWVRNGMKREEFPDLQKSTPGSLLVIQQDGVIHYYGNTPDPVVIEERRFAIGCGSEYADAALYLGKTAREAVEVAIALDSGCGNGIDTLELQA